jgi:putative PIN family toxin of toxin-antitoxin system
VLDTSVVVSALRSQSGASRRLLGLVADRRLVPLATPALFLEYEDVLKRPEQREVSGLTLAQVDVTLAALAAAVEPVEVRFAWRPQLADPDDEMVLDAAVNGRADALVTHNLADFAQVAPRFGLIVVRPGELLERMRR